MPAADAEQSLAYEEELLALGEPCWSVRTNDPCVSVGFNQSIEDEVDTVLAGALGIPVIRRKTGGGAVYRDRGCIVFSFVITEECRDLAVEAVRSALGALGIETRCAGGNDLFWRGRKVSGFAWRRQGGMLLLHGTLLYDTDIGLMARLLDCGKPKYRGTAIASAHARVANLAQAFPGTDADGFEELFASELGKQVLERTERAIPRVAFVCTGNACRSQMAEAVARRLAEGAFEPFSAGTRPGGSVNAEALETLSAHGYGIEGLHPKALADIPPVDWVVTMGCGVHCPALPCAHREDWGLEDPDGGGGAAFESCLAAIEAKMADLKARIAREAASGESGMCHADE